MERSPTGSSGGYEYCPSIASGKPPTRTFTPPSGSNTKCPRHPLLNGRDYCSVDLSFSSCLYYVFLFIPSLFHHVSPLLLLFLILLHASLLGLRVLPYLAFPSVAGSSLETADTSSMDGLPTSPHRHDLHDGGNYDPKSPPYMIPEELIKQSQEEFKNYNQDIKCETDTRPSVIESSAHHAIECT